jgi:putative endonuclease
VKFVVYILQSIKTDRFYVGQTQDLTSRIKRHNSGLVKSTKHGMPWNLVHSIEVPSRSSAVLLETKIKKRGAKRFLLDMNLEP